jgi:acyl carrier protein
MPRNAANGLFTKPSIFENTGRRRNMSVQDQVMEIIANQLSVAKEEVTPKASFVDDLGADSLDLVELVMAMEEKFGVDIADEDAEKMKTVQDAVNYIQAQQK